MILATHTGDREMFGAFDSSTPIPRPSQYGRAMSYAGRRVSLEDATGLPAFMRGVRLLAETTAMMPANVYRGLGDKRRPEATSDQQLLLHRPNPDMTRFDVWSYSVASMLRGNAFLWKVKAGRGVEALFPLDPSLVTIKYEKGETTYEIRERELGPVKMRATKADLIHIPGILLNHPCIGVSVVEAHRHGLGTFLARQEFEARYLANDGTPGVVLKHPANQTEQQREDLRTSFMARHQGPANAGRPAVIWGGWEIDRLAVSMEDAQFIESQKFTVQEIARMLGVPAGLLGDPDAPGGESVEQENMRFLTYGLSGWMNRLEQGLAADRDLFPQPDWSVELDPAALLRADTKTIMEAAHRARQAGIATANELRPHLPFPLSGDHPDGDVLLATPVGGAPNEPVQSADVKAAQSPAESHFHMHVDEGAVQFHPPNVEFSPPDVTVNAAPVTVRNVVEPGAVVMNARPSSTRIQRDSRGLIEWVGTQRVVRDEYGRVERLEEE